MPDLLSDNVALGTAPSTRAIWIAELRSLGALALPIVLQTSAQQGMIVTDQVFLGHLGTSELGAAALANSYTNLMWFFLLGFATALDTLGSHAYGAGDRRALVTWCITATVLVSALVAPMSVGMALGEPVARTLFGQDEHTSLLMGRFCNGLILGIWPLMWGTVLTKYLQVQNIMLVPSLIAVATFFLNIAFNAALVHTIGFGGAPLATSLSRWVQFLMLVAAVWRHERPWQQQPQRQRRPSNDEDEELERARAGLELEPLTSQPAPVNASAVVEYADRSHRGRVAADRSHRGATARAHARHHSENGQEPLLTTGPELTGDAEDVAIGRGSRADGSTAGGARVSGTGGGSGGGGGSALRAASLDASGRTSLFCGTVDAAAARRLEGSSGCAADAAAAPVADSLWRMLCRECRMAMHPRVVARFLRLGIPGGLSMAFEAGCFDFSTVLAGRLGAVATAAHAAMLSVVTLTYLACPFALATAGAIRVGNLLGAGEPEAARRAGSLAVTLSGVFMALMAVIILATRSVLGYMFSTDPRVVSTIRSIAVFAALFQVSDGLMGSSQGVLRGCGHQHLTAVFNFLGFWVCGVLLGFLLCFKAGLGLNGLWAGISAGDTATGIMNLVAMSRIRWQKEADKAVSRLKALAQQAEEEKAMLADTGAGGSDGGDGGELPGTMNSGVSPLIGGGRSYATGLKRMRSERRLRQAVRDARRRLELSDEERQGSVTSRFMRSLSSMFRRSQLQEPPGDSGPAPGLAVAMGAGVGMTQGGKSQHGA